MATNIQELINRSTSPVAYLGKDRSKQTGWAAWGFNLGDNPDFNWKVAMAPDNKTVIHDQALLTKAGVFYIWDNTDWTILYQKSGSPNAEVLIEVDGPGEPQIIITVAADGSISAKQIQ